MEPLSASGTEPGVATPQDVCETVLACLDVGIVLEDPTGRALACNPSAQRILGLTREQLTGAVPVEQGWTMIHEDGWPLPDDARPASVALRSGRPCTGMTLGVKTPGGDVRWVAANAYPLFEPGADAPYAAAASYADVTDARAGEEARRRSGERFRSLIEYSTDVIT